MLRMWSMLLVGSLVAATTLAQVRQMESHEHGVAQLMLVLEGELLQVEWEAPSESLVGFEHPPEADADREVFAQAVQTLTNPERLFVISEEAECLPVGVRVENTLFKDAAMHQGHEEHEDDSEHEHSEEEGHETAHSEFQAQWRWLCHNPEAVEAVEIGMLREFPRTEEIRVQWLVHEQQGAQTLQAGDVIIQGWD